MESHAEADNGDKVGAPRPRSLLARLGIVVLNLVAPGLGLIRLGRLRAGLCLLFAPTLILLLLDAIAAVAPTATFRGLVAVLVPVALVVFAIYVTAIVLGWRYSRLIETTAWWSRWYALIALWLIASNVPYLPVEILHHRLYKPYYIPAEGMRPTLAKWDRILVDMSNRTPRRGEVIVFRTRSGVDYIKRVAALGGDSFAMRDGVPIINGVAADQRAAGTMQVPDYGGRPVTARRLSERLPGEQNRHFILDIETSEFDNTGIVHVPIGSIFVLGDNRDRSADSRVPPEMEGAGIVPLAAVRGQALFITYGPAWSRRGIRINP